MKLTEALKLKEGLAAAQLELLETIENTQFDKVDVILGPDSEDDPVLLDYHSDSVKKRAMTVGTAFSLAFKYLLAIVHDSLSIKEVMDNSIFVKEQQAMSVGLAKLDLEGFDLKSVYFGAINMLKDLDSKDADIIQKVASYAVSLAWFKAYYESGYFPADKSIMYVSSGVHQELTKEVSLLLKRASDDFILPKLVLLNDIVILDPVVEAESINYTADLIFGDILLDIHTTTNIKLSQANAKKTASAYVINSKSNQFNVNKFAVYYPRLSLVELYTEVIGD